MEWVVLPGRFPENHSSVPSAVVDSSYSRLGAVRVEVRGRGPSFRTATEVEVREHMAAWSRAGWELQTAYTVQESDPRYGVITAFHFFWKADRGTHGHQ